MAQVNIKPNRIKFIKALEISLERIHTERKNYEAANKQYRLDLEAWASSVDLSPDNIKETSIRTDYRGQAIKEVVVTVKKLPTGKPKEPTKPSLEGYRETEAIEDLKSVIAMLKLTDEETVNASVANKVAKYL